MRLKNANRVALIVGKDNQKRATFSDILRNLIAFNIELSILVESDRSRHNNLCISGLVVKPHLLFHSFNFSNSFSLIIVVYQWHVSLS
jgi:hypothetical protein